MRELLRLLPAATRASMIEMYRAALDEQLGIVADGLADPEQAADLQAALHKIAGSAGMMQDQPLSQAARALGDALQRSASAAGIRGHWDTLRACAGRTREMLAQECGDRPG